MYERAIMGLLAYSIGLNTLNSVLSRSKPKFFRRLLTAMIEKSCTIVWANKVVI